MALISAICFVALFLIVWFETNAFIEYGEQLFPNLFHIDEYLEVSKDSPDLSYLDYMLEFNNSFVVRLVTCPICTSVWVGGFVSLFIGFWLAPVIILGGLVLYFAVKKAIL